MKKLIHSITAYFYRGISDPDDPEDIQLGKRLFIWISLLIFPFGLIGMALGTLGGSPVMVRIAVSSAVIFPLNLLIMNRTRRFALHSAIFSLAVMLIILAWGILLGGFRANFGAYWAIFLPLILALLVSDNRGIWSWFVVFSLFTAVFAFLDPYVSDPRNAPSNVTFNNAYTVINCAALNLLALAYYKRQKNQALDLLGIERDRSESLLLNILPQKIADTLKVKEGTIAEQFDSASILFADLVGFTPMTAEMTPPEMIALLNNIYSHFDRLAEKYGVEKIRTIGDNYMVASGVPVPRPDHAQALAHMALDMLAYAERLRTQDGKAIQFRIGINSGPLVAGVIGRKKFHYDVWGDTVNTASRMESHGEAGKVQITTHTREILKEAFACEKRGIVDIKGKGEMETWWLVGRTEVPDSGT